MDTVAQLYDLSGKGAVVTGGAMGIGKAIATRLAEAGAAVMIADVDLDSARQAASELQSGGGTAQAFEADVRNPDDAKRTVQAVVEAFGDLSILVNNAGIYPICPVMDITEELWDRVLGINLKGSFVYSQAAADQMIKGGKGGRIVNMASIDALHPNGAVAHYNASKGGLLMLTKALALELAPHGILVNAVAPGSIITPGTENIRNTISQTMGITPDDILQNFLPRIPLGRMGEPDDIAKVVLFLCSGAADYITGDVLVVDGGFLLS